LKQRIKQKITEPGLVAFYDIRPENGAGLFLEPRSQQRAWWHAKRTTE